MNKDAEYRKSIVLGALAGIGLAIVFAAGFFIRDLIEIPPVLAYSKAVAQDPQDSGYPLLDEAQALVDQIYLREQPDYIQRQYAAIRGVLGSLEDRNTFFIEPAVTQSESDVFAGTYGGIGVQVKRIETGQFALYPFPDGPAAEAGIQDGDILIAVNDAPIDITEQQDAVDQKLRGEVKEGSGVQIQVLRSTGDTDEPYTAFIEFAVINVPSVVWRSVAEDSRIGYVQILRFTNRTPSELEAALQELEAGGVQALILDVRNNSGGLLQESVDVASQFLDGGVVVYEKSKNDERVFEAETGGPAIEQPMVVLINNRTASASELVAGAIQDRDRGILIGQQSYGKGTVQQIVQLSNGSSLHITSAEWFTPDRNSLDGVGLEPDIAMIPDENGRDVEIGEAIRYLQGMIEDTE